jgi:hypothetical protein
MKTANQIDWTDVEGAAHELLGNWQHFDCFSWHRGYDLPDADNWMLWYTSSRDAGLLEQSNEKAINERLQPYSEGDNPDLLFETHSHWACGYLNGVSIRVIRADGSISPAFTTFCKIKEELDGYPVLDETDYGEREYAATLENYRNEMWRCKNLPEGWEEMVYRHFSDNGHDQFVENRDDQGGYAPEQSIIEALKDLGLMRTL